MAVKYEIGHIKEFPPKEGVSIVDCAMSSSVDHPPHYTFGKYEVIEVIEDWKLGYHLGNAVKYIARAGKKNSLVEDLQKAIWYINRYVENYKECNSDNSSRNIK